MMLLRDPRRLSRLLFPFCPGASVSVVSARLDLATSQEALGLQGERGQDQADAAQSRLEVAGDTGEP